MAVTPTKAGHWRADFRDQENKRHRKTFKLKKQADAYERDKRGEVERGEFIAPKTVPTFRVAAEEWLASRADREAATYEQYKTHLELHSFPKIGHLKLNQIDATTLERKVRDPLVAEEKFATANKVLTTLTTFWKWAMKRKYARPDVRSPAELAERVRIPERLRKRRSAEHVYSPDQILAMIDGADALKWQAAFALLALGPRREEILGFMWSDVAPEWETIKVERAVTLAKGPGETKRVAKLKSTKTKAGERWLPLPPPVALLLKKWKLVCPPNFLNLIFPNENGGILHPSTLYDALKRAQERAGVSKLDIKAFRHTFATALLEDREPDTEVARLLGHADTTVTRRVYAHVFNRPEGSPAVTRFAELIFKTPDEKKKAGGGSGTGHDLQPWTPFGHFWRG